MREVVALTRFVKPVGAGEGSKLEKVDLRA
jgi:hypothetical protein